MLQTVNTLANGLTAGQFAAKILSHAIAGGIMSNLGGGKFGDGFLAAGVTQALGMKIDQIGGGRDFSWLRTGVAAFVGGTTSALSGGKFANGALTAAFSRAFNDSVGEKKWRQLEQKIITALRADGFTVLERVGLRTVLDDGTEITAIADYVIKDGDNIIVGEIKDGMGSRLSKNQKAIYTNALKLGKVFVVTAENIDKLDLAKGGKLFASKSKFVLHALVNSRSARQLARLGGGKLMRVAAFAMFSATSDGVGLLFYTSENSALTNLQMENPEVGEYLRGTTTMEPK